MAWEWTSARTKVARRLVLLFVTCALAPLCAFAALASWMVTNETRAQLLRRLHVDAKAIGMGTVERMLHAESRLRLTGEILSLDPSDARHETVRTVEDFEAVWLVDVDGQPHTLKGRGQPPALSPAQHERLAAGDIVISAHAADGEAGMRLDMAVLAASRGGPAGYLVASADALALWDLTDDSTRPPGVDACVLDEHHATLACSDPHVGPDDRARASLSAGSGMLTWRADGRELLGGYWSAPLAGQFHLPSWTFVVMQPADATATVTFRRAFTVVVVLTSCLMVGVSLHQIRRRLEPLERLQDGAARIRAGDFEARVMVSSGDEFEALAESFNRMAAEVQRRFLDLQALSVGTFEALARTVDAKSPWTAGHSQRVTLIGVRIGVEMGLPPDTIECLRYGGLLHDIGKLGVPSRILDKAGGLTPAEAKIIRMHPELGARILEPIAAYAPMIPIVLEHHERLDGSGYPHGLAGEQISLGGRIFAVADVVDAMLSDRPYRQGIPIDRVVRYIADQSGHHFDPDVVAAFLRIVGDVRVQYQQPEDALRSIGA
jgi:HD-GYP domain-containing protein (c-di-GMP phosphodiesterase class II)